MSETAGYGPGFNVHWIQAKKGSEDNECWIEVEIAAIEPGMFRLVVNGEDAAFACIHAEHALAVFQQGRTAALLCERWHLLGIPRLDQSEPGPAAIATGINDPLLFRLAGTPEVRMFSVKRVDSD